MKKGALINCTNSQENTCARASFLINSQAWALQLYLKKTLAHAFSCEFCEISKNILFIEHLWMTASDFICGVFFIFSIIKNFRHEKRRFVRKKSTSGKPALHFESDLPSFSTLYILSIKSGLVVIVDFLTLIILLSSFVWAFPFLHTQIPHEKPFSTEFFFLAYSDYGSSHWEVLLKNSCSEDLKI